MSQDASILRALLGDALPPDAVELRLEGGRTALAWRPAGHAVPMTVLVTWSAHRFPMVALVAMEASDAATWLPGWAALDWHFPATVISQAFGTEPRYADSMREFAASFSHPLGVDAASFAGEGLAWTHHRTWEWLTDPAQGPSAVAFCRAHPWLTDECLESAPLRERLADGDDIDAVAVEAASLAGTVTLGRVTLGAIGREAASDLVGLLRGFGVPRPGLWADQSQFVCAVSRMPRDTWPAPVPGRPRDAGAHAEMLAFLLLSRLAERTASEAGRDVRAFLATGGRRWAGYLAALHARCGLAPVVEGDPARAALATGRAVSLGIDDMFGAFAREVVETALVATGMDPDTATHRSPGLARRGLVGERTLPRLCEVSARWHGRSSAIAGYLQSLRGDDEPAGPLLFGDVDLGDGIFATCLRTPEDLAAEGTRHPDAAGVPGLAHCVASYADRVMAGKTAIASVRRRLPDGGYERLSTAEVDFGALPVPKVRQHFGRGNSPPSPEAVAALPALLAATAREAARALHAHRPPKRRRVSEVIHEAGAWEAVRDLWSFALTRPQRSMGPAELVASLGGKRE